MRRVALIAVVALLALGGASFSSQAAPTIGTSRILYASDWSGHMQIYAVDPARPGVTHQVTFGGDGFVNPQPSPDGRLVAYLSSSTSFYERPRDLWVARANGTRARRVATGYVARIVWSPDSTRLAYELGEKLHIVRADGSGDRIVPFEATPVWIQLADVSPDGRWVVATTDTGLEIRSRSAGTARPIRVEGASQPVWSSNSRLLGFTSPRGIHVAEVQSGRVRRLTRATGFELTWSPDSRSLAFHRARQGPTPSTIYTSIPGDLLMVTLAGQLRTIVDDERAYGGRIVSLAWTQPPAAVRYRAPEPAPPTRIAPEGLLAGGPIYRLAADGDRVAFVSCEGVFAWTPATGDVTTIRESDPLTLCREIDRLSIGYSLAVAGDRLVYADLEGCHSITLTLRLEVLAPSRKSYALARGRGTCGFIYSPGVGWVAGAGDLLVFSTWSEDCPPGCSSTRFVTTQQQVHRVAAEGCPCPVLASSPGPLIPADVDAGRVVAYGENDTLVLDGDGRQLLSIRVSPVAAQLSGPDLALVLRGEIRHYHAATGALLHAWPIPDVPAGVCELRCFPTGQVPRLFVKDLARGLVAYVLDGRVHVLRLADGADAVVARGTLARFMDAGLVYADGTRIHLVPFDRLPLR